MDHLIFDVEFQLNVHVSLISLQIFLVTKAFLFTAMLPSGSSEKAMAAV